MTDYPEHDKQSAVLDQAQAIGDFLNNSGYVLATEFIEYTGEYVLTPVQESTQRILADYFDIDLNKIEDEKRAMLEELRKANQ